MPAPVLPDGTLTHPAIALGGLGAPDSPPASGAPFAHRVRRWGAQGANKPLRLPLTASPPAAQPAMPAAASPRSCCGWWLGRPCGARLRAPRIVHRPAKAGSAPPAAGLL
eukprot:2478106-Alexandrium_andersonii.AAC.1